MKRCNRNRRVALYRKRGGKRGRRSLVKNGVGTLLINNRKRPPPGGLRQNSKQGPIQGKGTGLSFAFRWKMKQKKSGHI